MVNFDRYGSTAADRSARPDGFHDRQGQADRSLPRQLQKVFADEAPVIPLWSGLDWAIFSNKNFTNCPSQENNYSLAFPQGGVDPEQIIVMTSILPK